MKITWGISVDPFGQVSPKELFLNNDKWSRWASATAAGEPGPKGTAEEEEELAGELATAKAATAAAAEIAEFDGCGCWAAATAATCCCKQRANAEPPGEGMEEEYKAASWAWTAAAGEKGLHNCAAVEELFVVAIDKSSGGEFEAEVELVATFNAAAKSAAAEEPFPPLLAEDGEPNCWKSVLIIQRDWWK